jgi:hypothetical protein
MTEQEIQAALSEIMSAIEALAADVREMKDMLREIAGDFKPEPWQQ